MQNLVFTQLSIPEIRNLLRQELEGFFQEKEIRESQDREDPRIVDLNGLLKARPILGSKSTIYKKASQGLIPHAKQGKKLFFDLFEIDEWLLANGVKSIHKLKEYAKARGYEQKRKGGVRR